MATIETVAVSALIVSPEMYDGQQVRLTGPCSFQFEGNAIWAATEYMQERIRKNAIWLALGKRGDLLPFSGQVMVVEGTFSAQKKGHKGMYSGALTDITMLEPVKAE